MRSPTEAQVRWPSCGDVEPQGIVEDRVISIRRCEREEDQGSGWDHPPVDLDLGGGNSRNADHRAMQAHHFVDGLACEFRTLGEYRPLVRREREPEERVSELIARGVVTGEEQTADHRLQLPAAQPVAVFARLHELGHQVLAWRSAAVLDQVIDVQAQLPGGASDLVEMVGDLQRQQVRERLAPSGEPSVVVAGDAEHFAHHRDRVVIGEVGNELTPSLGREGVHESVGQVPHGHPVTIGGPRRERSCHQATKARVLNTILGKDGVGQKRTRLISFRVVPGSGMAARRRDEHLRATRAPRLCATRTHRGAYARPTFERATR